MTAADPPTAADAGSAPDGPAERPAGPVRLEVENGVGTIRLDRPKMNAIDRTVQAGLIAAAAEATRRADIRTVIVYGGPRVFAAGADIKDLATMTPGEVAMVSRSLSGALSAPAGIPKPTVAALTGYALGGGLEVALSCDRRIAGESTRLGLPEVLLGVIPGGGGTQRLARLVGPARAKDMIYTGRFVDAAEALAIGLVDEVVPDAEVYERARAYVEPFTRGPMMAYAAAKRAIDSGLEVDLQTGLAIESDAFAGVFATEDRVTGFTSFVEHGPGRARFVGR